MSDSTDALQALIDRLAAGDESARDELIAAASARLQRLVHKLFSDYRRLARWVEIDDAFQESALRLTQSLSAVRPGTVSEFFRLAACQIRRVLLDLVRQYFGPQGAATHHATPAEPAETPRVVDRADTTLDPARLAQWTAFHEQVEHLPTDERDVFDLCYYGELSQPEAADMLQVPVATVKRRWLAARRRLKSSVLPG